MTEGNSNVRRFLITGHPRSGTGYMAKLLQTYNLQVGHERMGRDGISSWMFAAISDSVPYTSDGSARSHFQFECMIHVVRDPMRVISSTLFTVMPNQKVHDYMRQFIVLSSANRWIERACRMYLGWNKLIDAQRPHLRIRVEEAACAMPKFLAECKVELPDEASIKLPRSDYNTRSHRMLAESEIRNAIPTELWDELTEYSRSLGYDSKNQTEPTGQTLPG